MSRQEPRRPPVRLAFAEAEAATSLGIGIETFRKMVRAGELPSARNFEGRKRWLVAELEAAISVLTTHDGEEHQEPINPWDRPFDLTRRSYPSKPTTHERGDPSHWSNTERAAKYQQRLAEWRNKIPDSDLHGLETKVLEQLARYGNGKKVKPSVIQGAGPQTCETLLLRGFIEVEQSAKDPTKIQSIAITGAGMDHMKPKPPRYINGRPDYDL